MTTTYLGPGIGAIAQGPAVKRPASGMGYSMMPREERPKRHQFGTNEPPYPGNGVANGAPPMNYDINVKVMVSLPRGRNNTLLARFAKDLVPNHLVMLSREFRRRPDMSEYGGFNPNSISDLQEQPVMSVPQTNAFLARETFKATKPEEVPTPIRVFDKWYFGGIVSEKQDLMPTLEERRVDVKLLRTRGEFTTFDIWSRCFGRLTPGKMLWLVLKVVPRSTRDRVYCELGDGTQTSSMTHTAPECPDYPFPGYVTQLVPAVSDGPMLSPKDRDSWVTFRDGTGVLVPGRAFAVGRFKRVIPRIDSSEPWGSGGGYDMTDPDFPLIDAVINAEVLKKRPLIEIRVDVM